MKKAYRLRKGRVSLTNHYYIVTMVSHNRNKLFTKLNMNRCLIKHMQELEREQRIKSIAFVIMPEHLHWQFQILSNNTLSNIVRLFKGRTAASFYQFEVYRLWQKGYYDHLIRNEEDLIASVRYIIANPLRAKLIANVADYPYWDCVYV